MKSYIEKLKDSIDNYKKYGIKELITYLNYKQNKRNKYKHKYLFFLHKHRKKRKKQKQEQLFNLNYQPLTSRGRYKREKHI